MPKPAKPSLSLKIFVLMPVRLFYQGDLKYDLIICSRRLQQTTFSDAFFFLGALRVSLIARIGYCTVKILLVLEARVFIRIMAFHRDEVGLF